MNAHNQSDMPSVFRDGCRQTLPEFFSLRMVGSGMRSPACQLVLALATLLVGPLLGFGGRASANYLVRTPPGPATVSLADLDILPQTGGWGETGTSETDPARKIDPQPTHTLPLGDLWAGLSNSGAGCGSPSSAGGSVGASGPAAAVSVPVTLPPLLLVRRLYFEDVCCRPPPFPSRLFRPPRTDLT
jgi:hypothetical protein